MLLLTRNRNCWSCFYICRLLTYSISFFFRNSPPKGELITFSSLREVQSLYLFNPTQLSPIHEPDSESVLSCGSVRVNGEKTELGEEECCEYDQLQDLEDCDQRLLLQIEQQHQQQQQQQLPNQLSNGTKIARMAQHKTRIRG